MLTNFTKVTVNQNGLMYALYVGVQLCMNLCMSAKYVESIKAIGLSILLR